MEPNLTASAKYRALTERLLENEARGTLSETEEDSIRDRMDPLWRSMAEHERAAADAWLAERRRG